MLKMVYMMIMTRRATIIVTANNDEKRNYNSKKVFYYGGKCRGGSGCNVMCENMWKDPVVKMSIMVEIVAMWRHYTSMLVKKEEKVGKEEKEPVVIETTENAVMEREQEVVTEVM